MRGEPAADARVEAAEAERLAREVYGLTASVRALPGEYDDNFHLRTDGGEFVLKVMAEGREENFLEMQCQALAHVRRRAPGLRIPSVRATREGAAYTRVTLRDGTLTGAGPRSGRLVWMLSYVPGRVLAEAKPHSQELLENLGRLLGELDGALADFDHAAAHRALKWDLAQARWIREHLGAIDDGVRRQLAEQFLDLYEREAVPAMPELRRRVIYGDANDYNVIVGEASEDPRPVGVIDFGDMHYGLTAAEPAVAAAYAGLGEADPLAAMAAVVRGFHQTMPLQEAELAVLFPLIGARLAVSVVNSAVRKGEKRGDAYVTISEAPAWAALERLAGVCPRLAQYRFRAACGLEAAPQSTAVKHWLVSTSPAAAPILDVDLHKTPCAVFDLSVGSRFLGANPAAGETAALTEAIFGEMRRRGAAVGIGRYGEARLLYTSPLFETQANPLTERRTVHLGLDLFAAPGSGVHAPIEGVVHAIAYNPAPLDYGHVVILRHRMEGGEEFYTLYGHLAGAAEEALKTGQEIARGERFARVGTVEENGGWTPHVHVQVIVDLLELGTDYPGVCRASERAVWTSLSPDPNVLLGMPQAQPAGAGVPALLAARKAALGSNVSVAYRHPLEIVRGWKQYLYDETGRAYLDAYNNVPLVGHSHPQVVEAAQRQLALLNTNTRYLHATIVEYAQRLTALLPEPLRVCYFLNSGSEANELALRLARTHTGREDVIVLEHAYHGHTGGLIDISPYKFNGPGGQGRKEWVHVAPLADDYRGPYRRGEAGAGAKYAAQVAEMVERVHASGRGVAAFIAETVPSVAGQIVFPAGYLAAAYEAVRAAGGVCIADEVQAGFGRLGTQFWGFATQGVVPDIVVLGKPIGNGFPLAAVITTEEIAASFANGMEFFSTFGGNPVAVAAGLAVLDVLEGEGLQENARRVGEELRKMLLELQARHAIIGDVRGMGLFLGVDLVRDRATRAPATRQAEYVVNRLRAQGVLSGSDGPGHNVLKLRPPLCFSREDAERFAAVLAGVLEEDAAQADSFSVEFQYP